MKQLPLDSTDLAWLARLARALLGEAHAADDLVQDTLVVALKGPIPIDAPRRAWLGSVARRLAARRFRSEARRARREEQAARHEALPDSAELLHCAEVAERVTAATRSLPEPFRRTILLRYLEGLTTEEIATGEGKPVDTVRWRLRRGLELLREELVRKYDHEWNSWSYMLLPLARSGGGAGLATIGAPGAFIGMVASLTMMKAVAIATAAIFSVGLWFLLSPAGDTESEGLSTPSASSVELAASMSDPLTRIDSPGERLVVDVSPNIEVPSKVIEDPILDVFGKVIDEEGEPVAGATLYLVFGVSGEQRADGGKAMIVTEAKSDWLGEFRISNEDWGPVQEAGARAIELRVIAIGFLRQVVPDILPNRSVDGVLIVLARGQALTGRVVDEQGRGVPDLELLAYTAGSGIHHVSPSQVLLRAVRANLGDTSSRYHQCRARTDGRGFVEFSGLPLDDILLHSLDPGWTIEGSSFENATSAQAGDRQVVWTAKRRLGVRLTVLEAQTGQPVEKASATFRFEVTFANGEVRDFGQWVGRGAGEVSFVLTPEALPGIEDRMIVRAAFYGTVRSDQTEVSWVADAIEDARGATGVAEVRIEIDNDYRLEAGDPTGLVGAEEVQEPPTTTLELDVLYADATPFEGELAVSWASIPDVGPARDGRATPEAIAPGRYRISLTAGDVTLRVSDRTASGSLPPWTDKIRCDANFKAQAFVTLPLGASLTILRPTDWGGEWFVHGSWRFPGTEEWQGSLGYSTDEASLALSAVRPAEWRFQLRQGSALAPNPLVRRVLVSNGDDKVL